MIAFFRRPSAAAALAVVLAVLVSAAAADPQPPASANQSASSVELSDLEQAFIDQMNDCTLVGRFTTLGDDEVPAQADRYRINSVSKIKNNDWVVNARIVYGDFDVVVPVPVKMHWAADTPVLSVTDLAIPGLGTGFSARLVFRGDRYAGTWDHGDVGGHMWGRIERNKGPAPGSR